MTSADSKTQPFSKIYLAGPISVYAGNWRTELLTVDHTNTHDGLYCYGNKAYENTVPWTEDQGGVHAIKWPIISKGVMGKFDYVGPYRMGTNHGPYNGTHGLRERGEISDEQFYDAEAFAAHLKTVAFNELTAARRKTWELCKGAIEQSDLVFAWIDSEQTYGTILEIGYAKAKGIPVWIGYPESFGDMWLVYQVADRITRAKTARQAFIKLCAEEAVALAV